MITDRTLYDFLHWKELRDKGYENMTEAEREEWAGDMKGAYNASDINRVSETLDLLCVQLKIAGYLRGDEFELRADWEKNEIPTAAEFSAYLKAVETIREAMAQYRTTPPTPIDNGSLDFQGANDIEHILLDVEELIDKMLQARFWMGELFSGEI